MNKISISQVIKDAIVRYKERWRTLLLISFISTIISIVTSGFGLIVTSTKGLNLRLLLSIANIGVILISSYFTYRLFITMIIVAKGLLQDEELTALDGYKQAKQTVWRFIGTGILMGLMSVIPMLLITTGIILGAIFGMALATRALFIISGLVAMVYLSIIFYFAIYAAVLQPKEVKVFSYSNQLVKGNFFKILLISLIPMVILLPTMGLVIYQAYNEVSLAVQFIYSILTAIPSALVTPFTILLSLVTMEKLEKQREITSYQ